MGYLLPLINYQSTQYANRTANRASSPFMLPPVFKVNIDKKLKDQNNEAPEYDKIKEKTNIYSTAEKAFKKPKVNYELISTITGKGMHFNESI
jgi:hypothetical protein